MQQLAVSVTALLGFIGLLIQGFFSIGRRLEQGHSFVYGLQHFFSYFSILTNLSVAVLLASYVLFPESRLTRWFKQSANNAAILLYILIVGLIFYALLYSYSRSTGWDLLGTHLIHGFVPIAYFLLWLSYFRKGDLRYQLSLKWLAAVLVYFVYVLIRGYFLNVYPYFFVNVEKLGYGGVGLYAVGIALFFILVGLLIIVVDKRIGERE